MKSAEIRAAEIAKRGAIHAAFISAGIAVLGFFAGGYVTFHNTSKQLEKESERSAVEFLRDQRRATYSEFAAQMTLAWDKLGALTDLFQPGRQAPSNEMFEKADKEYGDNAHKTAQQSFAVNLIGTDAVRRCVSAVDHYFLGFEPRLYDAGGLFRGVPFEELSKRVPLGQSDNKKFEDLINGFSFAAREDLGVGNSSDAPAGACD